MIRIILILSLTTWLSGCTIAVSGIAGVTGFNEKETVYKGNPTIENNSFTIHATKSEPSARGYYLKAECQWNTDSPEYEISYMIKSKFSKENDINANLGYNSDTSDFTHKDVITGGNYKWGYGTWMSDMDNEGHISLTVTGNPLQELKAACDTYSVNVVAVELKAKRKQKLKNIELAKAAEEQRRKQLDADLRKMGKQKLKNIELAKAAEEQRRKQLDADLRKMGWKGGYYYDKQGLEEMVKLVTKRKIDKNYAFVLSDWGDGDYRVSQQVNEGYLVHNNYYRNALSVKLLTNELLLENEKVSQLSKINAVLIYTGVETYTTVTGATKQVAVFKHIGNLKSPPTHEGTN